MHEPIFTALSERSSEAEKESLLNSKHQPSSCVVRARNRHGLLVYGYNTGTNYYRRWEIHRREEPYQVEIDPDTIQYKSVVTGKWA